MKWDKERLTDVVVQAGKEAGLSPIHISALGTALVEPLEKLIDGVRAEAIGWCWAEACSQYSKGLNPGDQLIPELYEKALLDLNPERK
jgi:hypothetical protein